MRPQFGHVLIASGLLMVVGCALPGQQLANEDFSSRSKGFASNRSRKSTTNDDRLAFKPPKSKSTSSRAEAESELAEFNSELESRKDSLRPSPSKSKSKREISMASHRENDSADSFHSDADLVVDRIQNSDELSSVKIQGIEFDETTDASVSSGNQSFRNENTAAVRSIASSSDHQDVNEGEFSGDSSNQRHSEVEKREFSENLNLNQAESVDPTNHIELPQYPGKPTSIRPLPPLPWQVELEELIAMAEQNLSQSKSESSSRPTEYLRKQAHLRLLYMMAQRQEDALTAIPSVSAAQQEYWQQMIWAMSNSTDTSQFPDPLDRAAQAISPLSAALRQLREEAPLSIRNMTFCRKISYFGNYERFQRSEFTPGQEVLLYTEIENFVSTPTSDGEYRTSLKSLIEIADEKGKTVWSKPFPPTEDFCRNPRRDYFHNYQFRIPEDIPTGSYTLKLTIADEISQKRVLNSLNFVVK